ncbi:kanadaptin [Achroia grisella]|uniref:kanadaptin n=1 Tax=Achroia grisella TaxID=688607 RepID=UPI0027D2EFFB|nr:kanadaptin [Achroia grisella]XP_059056634.1 kanadaptin [Achroia grisella]
MDNQAEELLKNEPQMEFKKPVLIGRIGKLPKKAKNEPEKSNIEKKDEESSENNSESKTKSNLPPAVLLKELSMTIPYKEPKWSGLCPDGSDYALEVLKSGVIVEKNELTKKAYYVFGRLANCDIVMANPTISRHHAVLQYKAFAEEGEPPSGWYIYDLGSTHGTFLNKDRLKPNHYTRVRVGHQIKFGNSTRTYIMLGPDFDCEGESELTVTEIKKRAETMKLERDRMLQAAIEQREKDRLEEERKREEQGVDWGMGEDAEDEPDLAENPYAVTANEELYLEDPKKTLRGYFEREGHELNYDCQERGIGQFMCRVELPMDDARGNPVVAEVIHRGKKKEAVIACALEACRILDRAGLLRQSKHESRRRKERDWSADDYYDSDDDTFLDRTGSVERKRKLRMEKHGAVDKEQDKPLTYDDLLKQIKETEEKIAAEEARLERLRASAKPVQQTDGEADALDVFMSSLKQGPSIAQRADISNAKMNIQKLKAELTKTHRLADLARPAHMPPLLKKDSKIAVKVGSNSVVYGKRIRLKEDSEMRPKVRQEVKKEETEFVEEMDSDEEVEQPKEENKTLEKVSKSSVAETISNSSKSEKGKYEKTKTYGPMRPPDDYVIPENYFDQETDRDLPEIMEKEDV